MKTKCTILLVLFTAVLLFNVSFAQYAVDKMETATADGSAHRFAEIKMPSTDKPKSPTALSGNYTIGGASPDYATFTLAVTDLVAQGVSGPVVFNVRPDTYNERFTIGPVSGVSATNTVTFQSESGTVTVSSTGTSATNDAMILLSGCDYIIFDGINIVDAGTSTSDQVEYGYGISSNGGTDGANFNVIKNCNILLGGSGSAPGFSHGVLISSAATVASGACSDNKLQNLTIDRSDRGIGSFAIAAYPDQNLEISNCILGSTIPLGNNLSATSGSPIGIIVSANINAMVFGNTIAGLAATNTASTATLIGLSAQNSSGSYYNNVIHGLYHANTTSTTATTRAVGFQAGSPAGEVVRFYNNFIYDIFRNYTGSAVPTHFVLGIRSTNFTGGGGTCEYFYNTVYLSTASAVPYGTLAFGSFAGGVPMVTKNNIFVNAISTTNPTARSGAIQDANASPGFLTSNNNIFNATGTNGVIGVNGAATYQTTLSDWQTNNPGLDGNSFTETPPFVNISSLPYDLHILTGIPTFVESYGTAITGITTDYDGNSRNATTPDIGADEGSFTPVPLPDNPASFSASTISTTQIDLTFAPNGSGDNVVIVWNTTGSFTAPSGVPPSIGSPFAGGTLLYNGTSSPQSHTSLTPGTSYYYKAFSYDGSIYSTGITANAVTFFVPTYTQSFDGALFPPVGWSLINAGSGNQWTRSTASPYAGAASMLYSYNSTNAANAWAFTPGIELQNGQTYRVSFYQKVEDATYPEKLKVTVGNAATVAAQTTTLWDNAGGTELTNEFYQLRVAYFTNTLPTGIFYFAFNCYSDADQWNLYVDEVKIEVAPTVDIAVIDFYQSSGLPSPRPGEKFNDYRVSLNKKAKDSVFEIELKDINSGMRQSDENLTTFYPSIKGTNLTEAFSSVNVVSEVWNIGLNSTNYSLSWDVSGSPQTPYSGPSVSPLGTDAYTHIFSPSARGTFITTGVSSASGDADASNDTARFRLRVYPDSYTRTIYDRSDNLIDTYVGWGSGTIRMKAGVRFTAPSTIKLAGVDFICRTEAVSSGNFSIQIRGAGSSTSSPGPVLYTQEYSALDYFAAGTVGDYIHFPFDDNAPVIAGGSDYWITIKAPLGVLYPAAVHNSGFIPGRSFYESSSDTTLWYPLVITTERAWIMRAVHQEAKTLNITALIEGFYNGSSMIPDTVTVELHNASFPYALIEGTKVVLNSSGSAAANFFSAADAINYYIVVKHRNGLETWSATPQAFSGGVLSYDFTTSDAQAYGNNLKFKVSKWCIFSGDIIPQDGLIDLSDVIAVVNDANNFVFGVAIPTDVNGDNNVDLSDIVIVINNANAFVSAQLP